MSLNRARKIRIEKREIKNKNLIETLPIEPRRRGKINRAVKDTRLKEKTLLRNAQKLVHLHKHSCSFFSSVVFLHKI